MTITIAERGEYIRQNATPGNCLNRKQSKRIATSLKESMALAVDLAGNPKLSEQDRAEAMECAMDFMQEAARLDQVTMEQFCPPWLKSYAESSENGKKLLASFNA